MTLRRFLSLVGVIALVASLCSCVGQGFSEKDHSPIVAMKIEMPESAEPLGGYMVDSGFTVEYLMPNDQWRAHIGTYYSVDQMERFVGATKVEYPVWCATAFRSRVHLESLIAVSDIPYFDTAETARRSVTVVPDCEPRKTYVGWRLTVPQ